MAADSDAKSLLRQISSPAAQSKGSLNSKIQFEWIGPLRTPPRQCSQGDHRITLFDLRLSKADSKGTLQTLTLTAGSLEMHEILEHQKPLSKEVESFLNP